MAGNGLSTCRLPSSFKLLTTALNVNYYFLLSNARQTERCGKWSGACCCRHFLFYSFVVNTFSNFNLRLFFPNNPKSFLFFSNCWKVFFSNLFIKPFRISSISSCSSNRLGLLLCNLSIKLLGSSSISSCSLNSLGLLLRNFLSNRLGLL